VKPLALDDVSSLVASSFTLGFISNRPAGLDKGIDTQAAHHLFFFFLMYFARHLNDFYIKI
jgi:hypothetical protein